MTITTAYRVLAYLLALSVAVQASLIAFGAFALENSISAPPQPEPEPRSAGRSRCGTKNDGGWSAASSDDRLGPD
jgi:hypothetical protein